MEASLKPLAGVGLDGVTVNVKILNHRMEFDYTHKSPVSIVENADITSCQGSVMHFVSSMLQGTELSVAKAWEVSSGEESSGEGRDEGAGVGRSVLRRNATVLMTVLIVLGVIGLLFGVFWGRCRMHTPASGGVIHSVHALTVAQVQERPEIVPVTYPKVCES